MKKAKTSVTLNLEGVLSFLLTEGAVNSFTVSETAVGNYESSSNQKIIYMGKGSPEF